MASKLAGSRSLTLTGSTFTVGGQNAQGAQNTVNTVDYKPSGPGGGTPLFVGANLQNGSEFTAEGQKTQGAQNTVNTVNYNPSGSDGGMPVFVGANLQLDGKQLAQALTNPAIDPDTSVKAFVEQYFRSFDSSRAGLGSLYQDGSMLTFEGRKVHGTENIVGFLTDPLFPHCHHHISTVDCQPSGTAGGFLVVVSGTLQLFGEQHARKFSQMFHLMPAQGRLCILNDIFRLNLA